MATVGARHFVAGLSVVLALFGTLALNVTPAVGGVGGSSTPVWPLTATVGELFAATVVITNFSTIPNDTEAVTLSAAWVTPACAIPSLLVCSGTNVDPDIFKVLAAVGDASTTPCAGVEFDVGEPDMTTGEVMLTPLATITLAPSIQPANQRTCQINVTLRVFQVPTNPASGMVGLTDPIARVSLKGVSSMVSGSASGIAQIQVEKGTPSLVSTSNPNTDNVAPGTGVRDTVSVIKAPGAIVPTGFVRFILCQPGEVTSAGCPGGTGMKVGADRPLVNKSAISPKSIDTITPGTYCWRARYLGDNNYNPTNHTDATTECFTVQ